MKKSLKIVTTNNMYDIATSEKLNKGKKIKLRKDSIIMTVNPPKRSKVGIRKFIREKVAKNNGGAQWKK